MKKDKTNDQDIQMSVGAVALLDVLGWKGIWTRKKDAIGDLLATVADVEKIAKKSRTGKVGGYWRQFNDLRSKLLLLSDTIVLTVQGDERRSIELATHIVASIIAHGVKRGLPMRGAISAGKFYSKGNVFVGPAIDEVAAWYEQTDWMGAILTPSADLVVSKNGPIFTGMCVLYRAPVKTIKGDLYYCVDWTFHKGVDTVHRFFGKNNLSDMWRELAPIVPDVSVKVRNTMDFYDSLMLEPSIREKLLLEKPLSAEEKAILENLKKP